MKTLVLIDGNAILHRAYHALPPMSTKDGLQVNAVYGFASLLLKILNDQKPDALVCAFDLPGGTFRDEMYEDYKATREKKPQELYDQLEPIKEVVDAFEVPYFEVEGFEADDVIGTIAKQVGGIDGWRVVIVTGDLDTLQLVDEDVQVLFLKKGISQTHLYDVQAVRDRFGFEPMQLIDYKGLAGDSSDNIKGVAGIGAKGATNLIQAFGSVEGIYDAIQGDALEGFSAGVVKKLVADEDSARLSKQLATIVCDVPVDFDLENAKVREFDHKAIGELFERFAFRSLIQRVPGVKQVERVRPSALEYRVVGDDGWEEFLKHIGGCKEIGMFVYVSEQANMFDSGLVVGVSMKNGVYVFDSSDEKRDKILDVVLEKKITIVGFDVKQMFHDLNVGDAREFVFADVMLEEYVLHAGRGVKLEDVLQEYADVRISEKMRNDVYRYVANVVHGIVRVHEQLVEKVAQEKLDSVLDTMEYPLLPVLYAMEEIGVKLDCEMLVRLHDVVEKDIEKLMKKMHKEAGMEFNISSSVQLREVLFDKLGLPTQGIKKGKTGYSTAASELDKLKGLHPIIDDIYTYRELTKLQSTYIDALPKLVKSDGRIHTTYAQAVTATGRLASHDPNLQNIPMRTELGREVRASFVPEDGYVLMAVDYSQFELRIVAHLSKDPELMRIFEAGEDVHTSTASVIHGLPIEKVTKDIRRTAKEVNFGVMYGMGSYGLSQRTGLSVTEARAFIDSYFDAFKGVKTFIDETIAEAEKTGIAKTMYGRVRALPEMLSDNRMMRSSGERMAINMPVQGTQADIMKLAMIAVDEVVKDEEDIRMLLQVHDELVFEVKRGSEEKWAQRVREMMEGVVELDVPVIVDVHVGENWRDMKLML